MPGIQTCVRFLADFNLPGAARAEFHVDAVREPVGECFLVRDHNDPLEEMIVRERPNRVGHLQLVLTVQTAEAFVDDHRLDPGVIPARISSDPQGQRDGDPELLAAGKIGQRQRVLTGALLVDAEQVECFVLSAPSCPSGPWLQAEHTVGEG